MEEVNKEISMDSTPERDYFEQLKQHIRTDIINVNSENTA